MLECYWRSGNCRRKNNTSVSYVISAISGVFANAIEQITFIFVVYSQVPLTGAQKAQAQKLKNVLLQGFANIEDIEPAVMEQNADLPEDERENIRRELGGFKSFWNDTEDSIPLCASLVIVPEMAFSDYNFRLRRKTLEADDEPANRSEYQEAPELIASLLGFDEIIDPLIPDLEESD